MPHRSVSGTRLSSSSQAGTPRNLGAPSQMMSMHASGRTRPPDVSLGRDAHRHATLLRGLHCAGHSAYGCSEDMAIAFHLALTELPRRIRWPSAVPRSPRSASWRASDKIAAKLRAKAGGDRRPFGADSADHVSVYRLSGGCP